MTIWIKNIEVGQSIKKVMIGKLKIVKLIFKYLYPVYSMHYTVVYFILLTFSYYIIDILLKIVT